MRVCPGKPTVTIYNKTERYKGDESDGNTFNPFSGSFFSGFSSPFDLAEDMLGKFKDRSDLSTPPQLPPHAVIPPPGGGLDKSAPPTTFQGHVTGPVEEI
jgi:hypothetical protein